MSKKKLKNLTGTERSAEIIRRIDPSLVFNHKYERSSVFGVYRVSKGGGSYILKVDGKLLEDTFPEEREEPDWSGVEHLDDEASALERATGVKGVTHLVHDYGDRRGIRALLKEYFEDDVVSSIGVRITNEETQERLLGIVEKLHHKGLVGFDFSTWGNVLLPDRLEPCIVDLGTARVVDHTNTWMCSGDMRRDVQLAYQFLF